MMVWWFFLLGCGAVGFTIKILLDHIKDADQISDQILTARKEIGISEERLQSEEAEAQSLKQELEAVQTHINTSKGTVETLQSQINKRKNQMARQGKFRIDS